MVWLFFLFLIHEEIPRFVQGAAGEDYIFSHTFRDHKNVINTWTWSQNIFQTDLGVSLFGLPPDALQVPIMAKTGESSYEVEKFDSLLSERLFERKDLEVSPDYKKLAYFYAPFTHPISKLLEDTLDLMQSTQRTKDRIELLLCFLQTFPYGVPPVMYKNRFTTGILVPPEMLTAGYGDCDSKSLFMASTLLHTPGEYEVAFVFQPEHILLGIRGPQNAAYHSVLYKETNYILCDPSGSAHNSMGCINFPERPFIKIDPMGPPTNLIQPFSASVTQGKTKPTAQRNFGYWFEIQLEGEQGPLHDSYHLLVSEGSDTGPYRRIYREPQQTSFGYNSLCSNIYLSLSKGEPGGYHLYLPLSMPHGEKTQKVPLILRQGHCFTIRTQPSSLISIWEVLPKGALKGTRYSSDKTGYVRVILPAGLYRISDTQGNLLPDLYHFDPMNSQSNSIFVDLINPQPIINPEPLKQEQKENAPPSTKGRTKLKGKT